MTSRAYRQLGLLRRTFSSPNISSRKKLYLSLIRSKLNYCSPVWRLSLIKHIELLETVQRRATKFILNNFELDYKSTFTPESFSTHTLTRTCWHYATGQVHQKSRLETGNIQIHNILYYQYKICIFLKALTPSPFKDQPLQTFLLQQSLQAVECSSPHRLKLIF